MDDKRSRELLDTLLSAYRDSGAAPGFIQSALLHLQEKWDEEDAKTETYRLAKYNMPVLSRDGMVKEG